MSQPLARSGDLVGIAMGGAIITTQTRTTVEGLPVARIGDLAVADTACNSDNKIHCAPTTATGSSTVFCEGLLVHRGGDLRVCGDVTLSTTLRTFVGT